MLFAIKEVANGFYFLPLINLEICLDAIKLIMLTIDNRGKKAIFGYFNDFLGSCIEEIY